MGSINYPDPAWDSGTDNLKECSAGLTSKPNHLFNLTRFASSPITIFIIIIIVIIIVYKN